jgi:hypothetical protein
MKFIYSDNRSKRETKIIDSAIRNNWTVSDIFQNHDDFVSSFKSESQRLKWAPILVALAFGENTAFHGFGQRIAEAEDISTKSWLSVHLLDECKHTEGFSRLLDYFYPSYKNEQDKLFSSRDALVFYGYTHRCHYIVEWLICTQIAEVFGRHCYKGLHMSLNDDPVAEKFLKNIILDEARHIAYINELIEIRRKNMDEKEWIANIQPFVIKMIRLGRNMFEAKKKGKNYHALSSLNIDVTEFCNIAESELAEKYLK